MKSSNIIYTRMLMRFSTVILVVLLLLALCVACDNGDDKPGETSGDGVEVSDVGSGTNGATDPTDSGSGNDPVDSGNTDPDGTGGSTTAGGQQGGDPTGTTASSGGSSTTAADPTGTQSPDTSVRFTVTVVDGMDKPMRNVIVTVFSGNVQVGMTATQKNGTASFNLAPGSYTFTLKSVDSSETYTYDQGACVLSASAPNVTVIFLKKATPTVTTQSTPGTTPEPETTGGSSASTTESSGALPEEPVQQEGMIYADPDGDGDGKMYPTAPVTVGAVGVDIPENDMAYFLFSPTQGGVYEFTATCSVDVSVGYFGMPHFVRSTNQGAAIDGGVQVKVQEDSANGATMVIGIKTLNGSAATAILRIERVGNVASIVAWEEKQASSQYLVQYTGSTSGTLTDLDVTDANLSSKVLKGTDGYYHFDVNGNGVGETTEPVVMMRITTESPYLASLYDVCSTSSLCAYYFDSQGVCTRRVRYNAMINSYAEVTVGSSGAVPLNDELIEMIKEVGTYMGWWEENAPQYRLEEVNETEESAWLFNCCYYA